MNFNAVKDAVARQFEHMQRHPLFRVDVDKDDLWETYLTSFPVGSNPVYRERTEHDCSCCKQFVRAVGDVVAVIDGKRVSLWDVKVPTEPAYEAVAAAMTELVLSKPIAAPFLHYEPVAGTDRNFEQITDDSGVLIFAPGDAHPSVRTWTHFFVNLDRRFVKSKAEIPSLLSAARSTHDVLLRSLREITTDAIDTVLELIGQNSLYRGEEHRASVLQFKEVKRRFDDIAADHEMFGDAVVAREQDIFAWTADVSGAVSRFRNTVVGTLLVDLSSGMDLDGAVRSFESKVAPTNYRRPNSIVTAAMIEKAREKVAELGLLSALDRRHARITDLTINNLLFADRAARRVITGDVFDGLVDTAAVNVKSLDKVEEVPIDRFLAEIVPRADSVEVMVEGRHQPNLVSLIAPVDPTARHLFKWDNNFSWSYIGEVADSIKEKVKKAGGNVEGDLCCRLAWYNRDDLDYHMIEPGGYEIYFGNRGRLSPSKGDLDVDMNVRGETREPVENIFYESRRTMKEGEYHLFVHQFRARETADIGFECEVDYLGTVHRFAYDKTVRQDQRITVLRFKYTHKAGIEIVESLPSTQVQRTIWGIPTQTFHRVEAIMFSPNHWDGQGVGNRHYLFMIDGCRNDGTVRGFFNEFLKEELNPHRKVFEVVASKMKPAESAEQLSGLGFSTTQRNSVICRVKGSFTRTIKITF